MAKVTNVDRNGNKLTLEQMIRRFNKKVQDDNILEDYNKHTYYRSKSVKRREKSEAYRKFMRKVDKDK